MPKSGISRPTAAFGNWPRKGSPLPMPWALKTARALEQEIAREIKILQEREEQAEKQRAMVLQAHMDASILERLKEKQKIAYQKEVQKQDERFIDELVSAERVGRSES